MLTPGSHKYDGRRARGLSLLLEVLIGLFIFSVGFLFVYGVFPMAQRSLAEGRNQLVANNIAREAMENERHKSLSKVAKYSEPMVVTETNRVTSQVEGKESPVDYTVTLSGDDGPVQGTRQVEVKVAWQYGGIKHETVLQSIVGQAFTK